MGAPMTRTHVLPFGATSATTPLLGHIAGVHADRIARFWPAPHGDFFVLPTARRHAAAILLERRWTESGCDGLDIVHAVERARDADLARILMRGEAADGLMKALGRMGESLWKAADYAAFLDLFADPEAVTVLRHMSVIEAQKLGLIATLPKEIRVPRIIARLPESKEAAEDLAEAFRLAVRIQGRAIVPELVKRWGRAGNVQKLFDMAAEALQPAEFGRSLQPPQLPAAFERVGNRKALNEISLEFRNCLRDYAAELASGRMAVYAVREQSNPAVALAIRQDTVGWRLADAKLAGNADLGDAHLRHLIEILERAGVRTGESVWALSQRLHDHVCPVCGPAHVPYRKTWRDRLVLGSLWD